MKPFLAIIILIATTAHGDTNLLERTRAVCRGYAEGFMSPATDLVYGKRLNGPRGLAVLESPAKIAKGRVGGEHRPYGYGSGIEDTAYQTGMLLFALCDAEEATGDPYFAELARRAFKGLKLMSTLSPVEGFVPRGPHPADGKTYYKNSSLDQHSLYVCGLWRYYRSRLASPAEKEFIREIVGKVIRRLEKAQWIIKIEDGSAPSKAGGSMLLWEPRSAALLLMMLAAAHDVTGDAHWKDEYDRFSREQDGRRWALIAKEIDRSRERRYTLFMNQHALRVETLRRIESSAERKAVLRRHLEATAEDMLSAPYFRTWRSLDWLGEESWEDAAKKEVANAYLQPLGVTLDSPVTVMDLWRKFDLNRLSPPALRGRRNRYEPIALATPAMVWQIALLSQKPELICQVQPAVCEMLKRVDFNKIDMGWASNYAVLAALWNVAQSTDRVTLLDDDFRRLEVGSFFPPVGAHTEYHFLPEAAPRGGWTVACFRPGKSQGAWQVKEEDGRKVMAQTFENSDRNFHPLLVAGDPLWRDYRLDVRFAPEKNGPASGAVFRYHNNRCYYFFGFEGNRVVLKRVRHEDQAVLCEQKRDWQAGREYTASVTVEGRRICAEIAGVTLEAEDDAYPAGRVALLADGPTRFLHVKVTTLPEEKQRLDGALASEQRKLEKLRAANPRPVLWKKIKTGGFGVGRNLRFGDLDGDGQKDVLIGQILAHGPRDQYSELSCLTAMTFDGKILWQIGQPDPEKDKLTNDVAFQIHDLDRDGRNEVVYCMNQEMIVADGATGKTKYKAPTPASKPPANKFPRILGDCLFFCDLRGRGYPQDIIIKDRYWHFWALTDRLEPLWEGACRTGHYPFAADVDGDGHDELAIGYALFDHDGKLLWNLEDQIHDHADGVAIVNFNEKPGSAPRVFYAASDGGAIYVDLKGNILKRHRIGHVQNPAIADFRPDLPGLETVSINFWGNQGILHFFDAQGEIYHDCEPNPFGSMCLTVNWTGQPGEYFVHNPNVQWGGMFDGWGRCVVKFPDDGHPDMCNAVLDITGDCRDEVVVWDPKEIWVYTQSDNPKPGKLYRPRRNPLYNYSNYQATISLPK